MDKEPEIIQYHFLTNEDLYKAYMPFVKNGGLFIKNPPNYTLGEKVILKCKLLEDNKVYTATN